MTVVFPPVRFALGRRVGRDSGRLVSRRPRSNGSCVLRCCFVALLALGAENASWNCKRAFVRAAKELFGKLTRRDAIAFSIDSSHWRTGEVQSTFPGPGNNRNEDAEQLADWEQWHASA